MVRYYHDLTCFCYVRFLAVFFKMIATIHVYKTMYRVKSQSKKIIATNRGEVPPTNSIGIKNLVTTSVTMNGFMPYMVLFFIEIHSSKSRVEYILCLKHS
jgi:hypothetical protein